MEPHRIRSPRRSSAVALGSLAACLAAGTAGAQSFEDVLQRVCQDSGGIGVELDQRCAESNGGDLSGDSNDSLNAGQLLSVTDATLARAHARQQRIEERLEERLEERRGEDEPGRGSASDLDLIEGEKWSLLVNGRAQLFRQEADGFERELEGEVFSFQVGNDVRLRDDVVVGGLFSYDRTDSEFGPDQIADDQDENAPFDPPGNDGNLDTNAYNFTLFGSYAPTLSSWVDFAFGAGFEQHRFRRNGTFQDSNRNIVLPISTVGEPDGWNVNLSTGAGYDYTSGALRVGPYARVSWVHTEIEAYTETDEATPGLALEVDEVTRDSVVTLAGLRASYAISTDQGVFLPSFRFEFAREWERDPQDLRVTLAQGTPGSDAFTNSGAEPDRHYQHLGIGLLWVLPNGWMPFVDFQTVLNRADWGQETITAGLRLEL